MNMQIALLAKLFSRAMVLMPAVITSYYLNLLVINPTTTEMLSNVSRVM